MGWLLGTHWLDSASGPLRGWLRGAGGSPCPNRQRPGHSFPSWAALLQGPLSRLNRGALTAPRSQPSLPATLLLGRRLTLGRSGAFPLWGSPMFSGTFLFGLLLGSTVPVDRALSGLTGVPHRLLGGGCAIRPWDVCSSPGLLRLSSPLLNLCFSPRTLWSRTIRCGLCGGLCILESSSLCNSTLLRWLVSAEGGFTFLR